jgi:hypothetical protein
MRLEYRELGLEIVSLEENNSPPPRKPPTMEENRDNEARDSIKLFLKEALA